MESRMLSLIQVEKVIPLFESMYPGAVVKFFFNQSSAHGAFVADTLNAKKWTSTQEANNVTCTQQLSHTIILTQIFVVRSRTWFFPQICLWLICIMLSAENLREWEWCCGNKIFGTPSKLSMVAKTSWVSAQAVNSHRKLVMPWPMATLPYPFSTMLRTKTLHLMMQFHPCALILAACKWCYHIRWIFLLKNLAYKLSLKLQAISAISCPNFTASLILLKCTGDGSKSVSIWQILHCLSRLFQF